MAVLLLSSQLYLLCHALILRVKVSALPPGLMFQYLTGIYAQKASITARPPASPLRLAGSVLHLSVAVLQRNMTE